MGKLLSTDIMITVRTDLVDEDAVTWTNADLLEYLNEGIRTLCAVKTDAYVVTEYIRLTDGTRQALPEEAVELFALDENEVSKRRATQVDEELLDETNRFWPAGTESTDVIHWTFDPRDRTEFKVYPPNDGYGSVRATYGALPDAIPLGSISAAWPVADQYQPAIVQYMLGAAYRRNTQRQDLQKSQGYTQAFYTMIGLGAQAQARVAPKVNQSPGEA